MVERFGVCMRVMVLAVINSRHVFPFADCFVSLYNFKVGQAIYLRAREFARDVALVVVEKPHLGHLASGRVLQRGLNLSLILVSSVRMLVSRVCKVLFTSSCRNLKG